MRSTPTTLGFRSNSLAALLASGAEKPAFLERKPRRLRELFALTVVVSLSLCPLASPAGEQQVITLRFVDFKSAKPIAKLNVIITLWNGHSSDASVASKVIICETVAKTRLDGTIPLRVPEPVPEHVSVFAPDLAEAATPGLSPAQVLKIGAVVSYRGEKRESPLRLSAKPGEIVILNKRLTAWDRMRREIP